MEGLGEFLKKGRQRASLSLEDLSKRTCIRIENLQSLEREDLDSLPSDAYVRGFVRQVCREVGLAPQDGIVRYEMLRASSGPPDEITWSEDRAEETAGRVERALADPERVVRIARKGTRWAAIGAAALAGILILVVGWQAIRSKPRPQSAQAQEVAQVTTDTKVLPPAVTKEETAPAQPPPVEARRAPAEAKKRPVTTESQPRSQPRATIRADTGAFPAVLPDVGEQGPLPRERVPEIVRPARPRESPREASTEATARESTTRQSTRRTASPTSPGDQLVLEVEAVRSVEVSVLLDGTGQPRRAALLSGERRRWKADQHFVLSATDGGAVRVYLNGKDLGLAGESGSDVIRTLRASR